MTVLRYIWSLKWSLLAAAGTMLASFLTLGMLGYVLYYVAFPVVGMVYPPLSAWKPDTVWPLIVAAGMVWSLAFLPAGMVDHALGARGVAAGYRKLSYAGVLWLGAVASWLFLIATNLPPVRA